MLKVALSIAFLASNRAKIRHRATTAVLRLTDTIGLKISDLLIRFIRPANITWLFYSGTA
jgi:hypothetical protein